MTDKEKAVVMAYTGVAMLTGEKIGIFYEYVGGLLGRSIFTHELADANVWELIKEKSKEDFIRLCEEENRPQGDLISREALKKVFKTYDKFVCLPDGSFIPDMLNEPYVYLRDIRNVIDNAPTVSFMISPEYVTELQNLNKELIKQLEEAYRPEGEWIAVGDNQPYSKDKLYGCSECGFGGYLLSDTKNVNFCLNCGAKMQKGGAK